MSKVLVNKGQDFMGNSIIILEKKKGKISMKEAYEALESENMHGQYLMNVAVPEEAPFELYEEGDRWELYEVDELLGIKAEEKFNEGYEACMKDYKI